ncbi:hypothetical protein [Clostridium sp. DL1XJH146]
MDSNLEELANKLENINIIREELIKLNLNPEGRLYYENDVLPLLKVIEILSYSSANISRTALDLNSINVSKSSKVKDAVEIIYDLNDLVEDVLGQLEKKVHTLLAISSNCCDKK